MLLERAVALRVVRYDWLLVLVPFYACQAAGYVLHGVSQSN